MTSRDWTDDAKRRARRRQNRYRVERDQARASLDAKMREANRYRELLEQIAADECPDCGWWKLARAALEGSEDA